jgi:hypothetical protein
LITLFTCGKNIDRHCKSGGLEINSIKFSIDATVLVAYYIPILYSESLPLSDGGKEDNYMSTTRIKIEVRTKTKVKVRISTKRKRK